VISCPKVLHLWVKGRRPPIYAVAGAAATLTTSKRAYVHLADMALQLRFVHTVGLRRLTAPETSRFFRKGL